MRRDDKRTHGPVTKQRQQNGLRALRGHVVRVPLDQQRPLLIRASIRTNFGKRVLALVEVNAKFLLMNDAKVL
jgi:hypothetical protein